MNFKSQLAPKGLQFNASDFIISDKYATVLTVISYPRYINDGYLSDLTNIPGVKVSIKHIPVPFTTLTKMLNKEVQTFITTTDINDVDKSLLEESNIYYANNGQIERKN